MLGLWSYPAFQEVKQIIEEESKWNYFTNFFNQIDLTALVLTPTIIICSMTAEPFITLNALRVMAAIDSCCMFIKMFDWLRLFEGTAFYILLVAETLSDIKPFMVLLFTALLMFGMPIFMLNLNRE